MYNDYSLSFNDICVVCSAVDPSVNGHGNEFCHDKFELICFLEGQGKYTVEGKELSVCGKTVMLIPPLVYHRAVVYGECSLRYVAIRFDPKLLTSSISSMFNNMLDGESHLVSYSSDCVTENVISVFERFENTSSMSIEAAYEYLKALLTELIILLSSISGEKGKTDDDELGAKVVRYLNLNIDKNLSLDRIAKRFFVSKYYLCRAFKNYSGTSVHSFINHKRIMHAKQLIESGESASRAAFKVGFGDYSAFYRAYVKIVGKSPTSN